MNEIAPACGRAPSGSHRRSLERFAEANHALDRGEAMPLTSFREAARTFDVIFAADASAAQGGTPVAVA